MIRCESRLVTEGLCDGRLDVFEADGFTFRLYEIRAYGGARRFVDALAARGDFAAVYPQVDSDFRADHR